MANETVELDAGAGGAKVAVDDAGADGVVQIFKLAISADGVATLIPADASEGLRVSLNNVSVADGGALPAKAIQVGGTDGTNFQTLALDSSGRVVVVDGGGSLTIDSAQLPTLVSGRLPVDGSGVTQPVSGTVTATGPLTDAQMRAVAVPVSLATLPTLAAGTNNIGDVDVVTLPALSAGNNNIGDVDLASAIPAGTNNIGLVVPTPGTTGGWTPAVYAAQTTTVRTVKGTGGTFGGYATIYNPNAGVAYVQLFNVASGTTVTLGTTTPDIILPIPGGAAANLELTCGIAMGNGIKMACTTTATGLTAPGTGLDMTLLYK